jgi:hypothetical protein
VVVISTRQNLTTAGEEGKGLTPCKVSREAETKVGQRRVEGGQGGRGRQAVESWETVRGERVEVNVGSAARRAIKSVRAVVGVRRPSRARRSTKSRLSKVGK